MITVTLHGSIDKPRSHEDGMRLRKYLTEMREYIVRLERMDDAEAAEACSAAVWDVLLDWDMLHRPKPAEAIRTVKTPTFPGGGDDDDSFDEQAFDERWKRYET